MFTPKAVARLRPRIEELAHDLVDRFCASGSSDLVVDYSGPLPAIVMAEALGVPAADRPRFVHWADDAIASVNVNEVPPSDAEFRAYVLDRIHERRRGPEDDLISEVVNATDGGDRLSDAQLVALVRLLLIAGIETTANLVATMVRLLLEDRSRWEDVAADRDLVPAAIEESLRLDPPLNWTPRLADPGAHVGECPIDGAPSCSSG